MSSRTKHTLRIILTGFSGTGKSSVAPLVARALGWEAVDTDMLVKRAAGKPVADIFGDEGEDRFRELEAEALQDACSRANVVVAAGGGAVLRAESRRVMADGGFVVCLEARPETILRRLGEGAGSEPLDRPLLAGDDPLFRIRGLKASRQPLYALCDWTIHTDALSSEAVAAEVVRAYESVAVTVPAYAERLSGGVDVEGRAPDGAACVVRTASRHYPVFVGWGALSQLGQLMRREAGLARQAYVVSDEAVFHHYGDEIEGALRSAEIPCGSYTVPPGEASKSLETASHIYDWLIQRKAERGHTIVALGGGMVTDLAGHVAATFARGLPLVHVPTSLLAMVDASIGGKVGVNHPQAKNMIGSFYQPRFVLMDVATLRTLSSRELCSGWAEVIKHAFIADGDLLSFLDDNCDRILALEPETTTEAIRRSVAIKAAVVSRDEREETGLRTKLNYGHTLAHAIESASGYSRFLHGEAVAVGMTAAAEISVRVGLLVPEVADRQRRLLERYHLPTRADGLDRARVEAAMALDKKVEGKAIRWVLLKGVGSPVLRDEVPPEVVAEALDSLLR